MYKATIVIPNINGKGWLKDSIESVYAQTEQNFQLIVVDNGSTDESLEQARSYCSRANFTPHKKAAAGLVWKYRSLQRQRRPGSMYAGSLCLLSLRQKEVRSYVFDHGILRRKRRFGEISERV